MHFYSMVYCDVLKTEMLPGLKLKKGKIRKHSRRIEKGNQTSRVTERQIPHNFNPGQDQTKMTGQNRSQGQTQEEELYYIIIFIKLNRK